MTTSDTLMGDNPTQDAADPLCSEAYLLGRRAGLAGLPSSVNPGSPGSAEEQQWLEGWYSGNAELVSAYADVWVKRDQLGERWLKPEYDMNLRGRS